MDNVEAWLEYQQSVIDKLPLDTKTTIEDIRYMQGQLDMVQKLKGFLKKFSKKDK